MLGKIGSLKKHHQLVFTLIVMSGMVAVWRGVWGLLDMYLFPGNLAVSYALSAVGGILIIALTHYTIDKLV